MIDTGSLISGDTIRTLGWTLAHFLWQGAALAAILWVLLGVVRSASARYRTAVVVLLLMSAAPFITFFWLRAQTEPVPSAPGVSTVLPEMTRFEATTGYEPTKAVVQSLSAIDWPSCFVWAWLAGVVGFGVRAAGGWMFVERLYREKRNALPAALVRRCAELQRAVGVRRAIGYFESALVDAPAVIGWFRPIVLLPVSALTGLSAEQLDAVVVHELAHIRRLDCFVNLFQIAAETALFYQPAIWWVSKVIRTERENCCDDVAVAVCGDARGYARALTLLATWRATPAMVLAANSGSLRSRISRLLGLNTMIRSVAPAGLAGVALLCAAGVALASTSFHYGRLPWPDDGMAVPAAARESAAELKPPMPTPPAAPPMVETEDCRRYLVTDSSLAVVNGFKRAPVAGAGAEAGEIGESEAQDAPQIAQSTSGTQSSYIAGLQAAGLKDLTVDELIRLKVQGVTPEYVREMHAAGLEPTTHELVGMKVQGVSPDYVREVRQVWPDARVHDIIGMKVQGITPDYVRQVRQTWPDANLHDVVGMKVQGVNPSDKAEFERLGLGNLSVREVIAFRVQNITPDYVRDLESTGLRKLTAHDVISAKVQGISPEFIREVQARGFKNLTIRQLIDLKMVNVF